MDGRPAARRGWRAVKPLVGMFLVGALALPALAGPLEDAGAAYRRGDYGTAARLYGALAAQGNADAQNSLGNLYIRGQGVTRNANEALKWFRRAAALGSASAQFNLAQIYFKGIGVNQDLLEAATWYNRAAEQGHAQSQFTLAVLYKIGAGVPANNQKSAFWFERAASQGHAEAQSELGLIFATGRGRPRDAVVAYKWLTLAKTSAPSADVRTKAAKTLENLAKTMSPAQIAQSERLAREWQPTPARASP